MIKESKRIQNVDLSDYEFDKKNGWIEALTELKQKLGVE